MCFHYQDEILERTLFFSHCSAVCRSKSEYSFAVVVRFLTAAFTCWYSGWSLQPGEAKKMCLTPIDLNNTVDLGPTKSGIAELRQIFGRVGFWVFRLGSGSCPIFSARLLAVSSGNLVSKSDSGINSSIRYHVCLWRSAWLSSFAWKTVLSVHKDQGTHLQHCINMLMSTKILGKQRRWRASFSPSAGAFKVNCCNPHFTVTASAGFVKQRRNEIYSEPSKYKLQNHSK